MEKFRKKWNGKAVEDWGSENSSQSKQFVRDFKSMLVRNLKPYGMKVVSLKPNHYDCSGFIENSQGKYVYISYSIPRGEQPIDFSSNSFGMLGVLYRRAESIKDFRGRGNHFASLNEIVDALVNFREWEDD